MDNVKQKAIALRDECERLAREAEKSAMDLNLTPDQRSEAMERAKAYWQMSRNHADTAMYAAEVRPERFTGVNKGPQAKTERKIAFLQAVAEKIGTTKRAKVVAAAFREEGFGDLFDSYEAAYTFAKPTIFDRIRKPSI